MRVASSLTCHSIETADHSQPSGPAPKVFGNAYAEQGVACFSTKSAAKLGTVAQCSGQLRNHASSVTAKHAAI